MKTAQVDDVNLRGSHEKAVALAEHDRDVPPGEHGAMPTKVAFQKIVEIDAAAHSRTRVGRMPR